MDAVNHWYAPTASASLQPPPLELSGPGDIDARDAARAARGDTAAFEALYTRHHPRVHRLACRMLGADAADDATQEVFFRVWTRLRTYRGESAFSTWLHRVAVNILVRWSERSDLAERRLAGPVAVDVAATSQSVDDGLDIDRALAALEPDLRAAVVLHDIEGFSHEEIGKLMGVSLTAARMRLYRARLALRAFARGHE